MGEAQHAAERLDADTLVGGGRVDPVRARHGAVGLLPARHKAVRVLFHALMQVDRHLDDLLGDLGRVGDDLVTVADKLDAVQHTEAALHQIGAVLAREHDLALAVAAVPQVVGDFLRQCAGHRVLGDAVLVLEQHAAVFAQENTAVGHRRKQQAQAGVLPPGCRAEQDAAVTQGADLVENFALQLFAAILQQRTVNVAADHFDCHNTTPLWLREYCSTFGRGFAILFGRVIINS